MSFFGNKSSQYHEVDKEVEMQEFVSGSLPESDISAFLAGMIPIDLSAIQLPEFWELSKYWGKSRASLAQHIETERKTKPLQSLVELAAQIAAMHVLMADAGEGPVRGSNPNFRISEKTGIVAVDSSIEAVLDQVPGRPFGIIVSVTSLSM